MAEQTGDPGSMLELHRSLLGLRRRRRELQTGSIEFADGQPAGVLAYERRTDTSRALVVLNFADTPTRLPVERDAAVIASTDVASHLSGGVLHLGSDAGVVLSLPIAPSP